MLLYNITLNVDTSIADEWLQWIKEVHVPDMMATGCFRDSKICRMHDEEEGGKTYAIMYTVFSQADLENYQEKHAARLQAAHAQKFEGKFVAFRTLLSIIHESQ